jgi:ABC-type glycerol-3-phosphate transport system substrate-binding protein
MKNLMTFWCWLFLVLLLLSVTAWWIRPRTEQDGKITLVWVTDDNPIRRGQVDLFNRTYPQYRLSIDPANSGMEKIIVQTLAGVGPDLFDSYSSLQSSAFVNAGIAWDITEPLTRLGIDVRRDIWASTHNIVLNEGRAYGFPRAVVTDAVFFNKTLFDQAGVPYPSGPLKADEFLELARKLTVRDATGHCRQYGVVFMWWNWQAFVRQWGGQIYTDDGTLCVLDDPRVIAAIQFMQDLAWKHKVSPTPEQETAMAAAGGWGSGELMWFGCGRAAMAFGGRWWLCLLRNKVDYPRLRLGVVEGQLGPIREYNSYCGVVMINKNSPKREHALEFLSFLHGREFNEYVNHHADGICPVIKYTETDLFLHDPDFPEEDFNQVWRETMAHSRSERVSPFINGGAAERIINEQLALVRNNYKSATEAMRQAAAQVNAQMQKDLARNPSLRKRYDETLRRNRDASLPTHHANETTSCRP